jgi:hypothetical protein
MSPIVSGSGATDELLEFDPTSEDADNYPLAIGPGTSYGIVEHAYPAPPLNVLYASSIDTEGENPVSRRHGDREITIRLEMIGDTAGALQADLEAKYAKLQRDGGTLQRTFKNGDVLVYDILAADGWNPVYGIQYYSDGDITESAFTLRAKPYSRGEEVEVGTDTVETTLPVLIKTVTDVPGQVPALGRLVIDEDDAEDQQWLTWGIESRNYSADATAALFYEAEGRTAMGGSAIAVGPSGASGAGSNVMRNTALASSYQAILSTQAISAGAHLSHIGTFRVFARVQIPSTNTGTVTVGWEWGEGDFRRFTQQGHSELDPTWEASWRIVDLGLVTLRKVTSGTQRWEGRVLAKSTVAGDDIDVDWLMFVPTDEGSGTASAVLRVSTPTVFSARDEFDHSAGSLTGKTPPVSTGVWVGAGDATDFAIDTTGDTAERTATSDTTGAMALGCTGRWATAGTGALTNVVSQVDVMTDNISSGSGTRLLGVVARYTDSTNFVIAYINAFSSGVLDTPLSCVVVVGDVAVAAVGSESVPSFLVDSWNTIRMSVDSAGRVAVWAGPRGYLPRTPQIMFQNSNLATSGTLASGTSGFYDQNSGVTAITRNFDNFATWAPVGDAALFASQSVEIRADQVGREDSGGTLWQPPSSYVGDYLRVPVAGAEGRTSRLIAKASRGVPGSWADAGTDDISGRLYVTPRYLT